MFRSGTTLSSIRRGLGLSPPSSDSTGLNTRSGVLSTVEWNEDPVEYWSFGETKVNGRLTNKQRLHDQ